MDALLILALGSLALLAVFATPALADHLHDHHRALRFYGVDVPRPAAAPVAASTPDGVAPEPADNAADSPDVADTAESQPRAELNDGDGQPSDYVANVGDDAAAGPSEDATAEPGDDTPAEPADDTSAEPVTTPTAHPHAA